MNSSQEKSIRLLKILIPEYKDIISDSVKSDNWLVLPEQLISAITNLDLKWWQFYEDESKLRSLSLLMILDSDEVDDFKTNEDMEKVTDDLLTEFQDGINFPILTEDDKKHYNEDFQNLSSTEQQEQIKKIVIFLTSFLCNFFNYLSVMSNGRTMCRLVSAAKSGDDNAFCLSVQIDRTVLNLPYYQQRVTRAQFSGDEEFLKKLAACIKRPTFSTRKKYLTLSLTFAILEDEDMLSLPHDELLDICEDIGVYGRDFGIEDVNHLSKRLNEYKKFQSRNSKVF